MYSGRPLRFLLLLLLLLFLLLFCLFVCLLLLLLFFKRTIAFQLSLQTSWAQINQNCTPLPPIPHPPVPPKIQAMIHSVTISLFGMNRTHVYIFVFLSRVHIILSSPSYWLEHRSLHLGICIHCVCIMYSYLLQLYCFSRISPIGNSGCPPWGKLAATESHYPTNGACWVFLCHIHVPVCLWIMGLHSRVPKKKTSHGNEVIPQDATHLIQRPCYQRESPCQDPAGNWTTRRPNDDRKETQTAVLWSFPVHQVWPKPSCKAQWKGEEDKADRGRGEKTTSGNGQAWSSASPRGQWRTGKNGENWLQNHPRCPSDPRG